MKSFVFAKRNFKEILRDKLSLIFCFAFPLALLLILEVIITGIGTEAISATPQFEINNLAPSIAVFSFSFLTLFGSQIIAKDRSTSFQARLNTSPMKSTDFVLGYILPLLPIAFAQAVVSFVLCFFFGLSITWNLLLALVFLIPSAILFIALGLLFGSIFSGSATSGMSSIVINLAAILGGMFFPIQLMTGAIVTVANVLPFYPALQIVRMAVVGDFSQILQPLLIVLAYTIVILVLAIFVFNKRLKSVKK